MSTADLHRETDPRHRLILARDLASEEEALRLADRLRPDLDHVKVGLQLFSHAGPPVVRKLVSMGLSVFLDLKLHDIPNTMASATRCAGDLGAHLSTVHSAAGRSALRAVVEAAARSPASGPRPRPLAILAVTVLTSLDDGQITDVYGAGVSAAEKVLQLGRLAIEAGVDGLVASPKELRMLREELGPGPLLVIPGIRPAGQDRDDQHRVASPTEALRAGADFLVIGRPILRATDPKDALQRILDEMSSAG